MNAHWEHFPHGADIGVRGIGTTMEEAFEQAALAVAALVADLSSVQGRVEVPIECEAPDVETLLVDWLNALVFQMATRRMAFCRFEVRINGGTLRGKAWGEPMALERHQPGVEVKGATYTELRVMKGKEDGTWIAQCIVDV